VSGLPGHPEPREEQCERAAGQVREAGALRVVERGNELPQEQGAEAQTVGVHLATELALSGAGNGKDGAYLHGLHPRRRPDGGDGD
jgi:hypothetical protein